MEALKNPAQGEGGAVTSGWGVQCRRRNPFGGVRIATERNERGDDITSLLGDQGAIRTRDQVRGAERNRLSLAD